MSTLIFPLSNCILAQFLTNIIIDLDFYYLMFDLGGTAQWRTRSTWIQTCPKSI